MSDVNSGTKPAPVPLSPIQRRVLGVLVEKAFTTPDSYPLTANSVVTACNQKSNREPVSNYEPHEVDDALLTVKDMGLVTQVFPATGRTERWKQQLRDAWNLERPFLSILAELFLRGPQSEGDLRARASRMAPIASLDELRDFLATLADRGLVRRLSPEGRKRGVMWGHLFLSERELAHLDQLAEREASAGDDEEAPSSPGSPGPSLRDVVEQLSARVEELERKVAALEGNAPAG